MTVPFKPSPRLAPTPFREPAPLPAPGWLQRLLRRSQPEHAERAIRLALASRPPDRVTNREISETLLQWHVRGPDAHGLLVRLWAAALKHFLADDALSKEELGYLFALRRAFDLGEDDIMKVEAELVHPRFQRALVEVLSDQRVEPPEREALKQLGTALRMSPALQADAFKRSATELLQRTLTEGLADRRLSPDEQEALALLAHNLGVSVAFDTATEQLMNRFALLWRIENGDLPAVEVPIKLERGESCHFTTPASWHEFRKRTETVGYYSQGVSFRIARGVYYRVGGSRPQRVTTEGLTEIDSGTLYVTSKRVLFDGLARNATIRLRSVISFQVFSDGLALEKGTGRTPYLLFAGDVELAAVILSRLLASA